MTSSTISPRAPDLAPLYNSYLLAFNVHSWSDILKYLSPTCHATLRGKLLSTSAEGMRPNYEKDFERCERHDVVIREMRGIERACEDDKDGGSGEAEDWKRGVKWGLRLALYDPTMRRTITVNYWYRLEDDKWMQCWHEILDSVADDAA